MALRYVTLADLQQFIKTQDKALCLENEQAQYEALITAVAERVEVRIDSYVRHDFEEHTDDVKVVTVGHYPKPVLDIDGPIIDVIKVEVRIGPTADPQTGWSEIPRSQYTWTNPGPISAVGQLIRVAVRPGEYYVLPRYSNIPEANLRPRPQWASGYENVRITYTHGYSEVPLDIKDVVIKVTSATLLGMAVDNSAQFTVLENPRIEAAIHEYFTEDIRRILAPYRSSRMAIGAL